MQQNYNQLLAGISKLIVTKSDLPTLLQAIYQQVLPIFEVESMGLFIINEKENYHYDLTVVYPEIDSSELNKQLNVDTITHQIPFVGTTVAYHFEQLKKKQQPIIFNFEKDFKKYPHPFSEIILAEGYKQTYGALLQTGNEALGVLYFNSKQIGALKAIDASMFQQVADLTAIALSNILTKEEIVKREEEKTNLLAISEAISKAKNTTELLATIREKVMALIPFEDTGILIVEKDGLHHYDMAVNFKGWDESHANKLLQQHSHLTRIEHVGSYLEAVIKKLEKKETPIIEDWEVAIEEWDHPFFPIIKHLEYKEALVALLKYGDEILGSFWLNSKKRDDFGKGQFALFQAIAEQVSVAVANILAKEEILEREKEKSILLSISQQISQIRDLDTLVNWLHIEANKMHQSQHVMIVLTNPKENTVQLILGDADTAWQQASGMRPRKGLINLPAPYKGSIFEYIESLPEGQLYSATDFNFPETSNFCSTDFQLAESFYVKLIHKGEPIGHISFHTFTKGIFKNIDIGLCRNFANQMAVSLTNILSNEAIAERERQKTFEIKINNAVLKNDRFEDVLKEVTESINKAVGCDICYIRIRSEDIDVKPFNLFCEKKGSEYLIKSRDGILKEMAVKHAEIEKDINDFFATLEGPLILTGTALEEKQQQFNYLKAFKNTFHIQSFAFMPLYVKGRAKVQLVIGSKRAFAYVDNDIETIRQIVPQLSLTLDNRLAFVQIQKLKEMLETENLYLHEEINDNYNFNEIVGSSEALQTVFSQASMVAGTDTTVLIGGETGTGKELIARAIHNLSSRKDKIMVKVNCACLPAQLIESELFGHEKGAFTGAIEKRIGKFELANGGTIFLDEIGELPLELQSKLLRVIQEREFERIGGRTTLKTDIRIIAATNKNLEIESNEKRFRSDLYYRLNVFPIVIPALKERKEDIPLLALHFAKKFGQKMRKNITAITNEALQEMMLYDWPGNIRELEHVIEHSVISSKSSKLALGRPLLTNKTIATKSLNDFKLKTLDDNERDHIMAILKYCNGRVRGNGGAAQILSIHPNTLESRMQKLGIKRQHLIKG